MRLCDFSTTSKQDPFIDMVGVIAMTLRLQSVPRMRPPNDSHAAHKAAMCGISPALLCSWNIFHRLLEQCTLYCLSHHVTK